VIKLYVEREQRMLPLQ